MKNAIMRRAALFLSMSIATAFGAAAADLPNGKAIYDSTCTACHSTGVAGAPKLGDVAAWASRIKTGPTALYANAIKGKGAMPARGGNAKLSDAEVQAAVNYIIGQSDPGAKGNAAKAAAPAVAKPAEIPSGY